MNIHPAFLPRNAGFFMGRILFPRQRAVGVNPPLIFYMEKRWVYTHRSLRVFIKSVRYYLDGKYWDFLSFRPSWANRWGILLHGRRMAHGFTGMIADQWTCRIASMGKNILMPHAGRRRVARSAMIEPPLTLSRQHRRVIERAITDVCAYRQWELLAVNCRTNHVHVVVAGADMPGEQVMRQFKAYATRALREKLDLKRKYVWT